VDRHPTDRGLHQATATTNHSTQAPFHTRTGVYTIDSTSQCLLCVSNLEKCGKIWRNMRQGLTKNVILTPEKYVNFRRKYGNIATPFNSKENEKYTQFMLLKCQIYMISF